MPRAGFWLAAAVVVVSNIGALGQAAFNRRAPADAALRLSERELRLEPTGGENTAMSLRLAWTDPNRDPDVGWFGREKLETLGFDCAAPPTRETVRRCRSAPARRAYAALEYDGPAWERYASRLAPGVDTASAVGVSHLVLVDVAADAATLRARYPERARVVIVPAVVRLVVIQQPGLSPVIKGRVVELLPPVVNVPRHLRGRLEAFARAAAPVAGAAANAPQAGGTMAPRYVVEARWGRRHEPWIEAIQLPAAPR